MSISNYNSTTNPVLQIKCNTMECANMVMDSATVNNLNIDNLVVNNSLNGTSTIDNSYNLSDGTKGRIQLSNTLDDQAVPGIGIIRTNSSTNIRSSHCVCNAISTGGSLYQAYTGIQNTVTLNQALMTCAYDNINYSIAIILTQGANNHTIFMDDIGGIQLSSPSQIFVNSNNILLLNQNSPSSSYKTSLQTDHNGVVSITRLESDYFTPVGLNINRITSFTYSQSQYSVIRTICSVNLSLQVVVGAGAGNPSFRVTVPILPVTTFSSDVAIGFANIYDPGYTTSLACPLIAQGATNDILITMIGASAATYNVKAVFSYSLT